MTLALANTWLYAYGVEVDFFRQPPAAFARFRNDGGENAAAHVEARGHAHVARFGRRGQIVKDAVGDGFVTRPLVAEGPHIEFQAFQLDALAVWNVVELDSCEIRLACFRSQAGKLRYFHMNPVIALRLRIGKGVEGFLRLAGH